MAQKFFRIPFASVGTKVTIPEATQSDGAVSYEQGYGDKYSLPTTDPDTKKIERSKMNYLFSVIMENIRILQIRGTPDWIAAADNNGVDFPYEINAIVRYNDVVYRSLTNSNTALPTDPAYWVAFGSTSAPTSGGTGITTYTLGDILYASATNVLSKLAGNTVASKRWLRQTGTGSASAAPVWDQPAFSDLSGGVSSAQGGAGTINGIIKANGAGVTSQAVAGTDYVVPGNAVGSGLLVKESMMIAVSDQTSNLTAGAGKLTFRMPYNFTLTELPRASVKTASTGSTIIVDINENGASIFSTRLSIDISEKSSVTAAVPAVLSDTTLSSDSEITIDIDQVGSLVPGVGLVIYLIGRQS